MGRITRQLYPGRAPQNMCTWRSERTGPINLGRLIDLTRSAAADGVPYDARPMLDLVSLVLQWEEPVTPDQTSAQLQSLKG